MKKVLFTLLIILLFLLSSCKGENICEEQASKHIPEIVTLKQAGDDAPWIHVDNFTWLDKTAVENAEDVHYRSGSEKGENVKYFYAEDDKTFAKNNLGYTKQSVSEDGTILGDNVFSVSLVLNPLPNTRLDDIVTIVGIPQIMNSTQDFEIVEVRFSSCKWYE
ncbi:hypothetical protein ACFLTH_16065 [Bacteroidota bacterium]